MKKGFYDRKGKLKGQRGWSISELLIAVAVMGFLASVAIPSFISNLEKAHATTCIIYRQNIQTAADYYIKTNNLQPGDTMPTLNHLVSENLLPNVDRCPTGGIYIWSNPNYQGTTVPFLISCSIHFLVGM
jgi:type II secretory pathway pseudopilin PulG